MDANRRKWNTRQKTLRQVLTGNGDPREAVALFLQQHAMLHRQDVSRGEYFSFADEVWHGATENIVRCLPRPCEHSIAWLFWHTARIEDMTMNTLLLGRPQVFHLGAWDTKMKIDISHCGNVVMDADDVVEFSRTIDIEGLKEYRLEVGRATREAVRQLPIEDYKHKVEPLRLQELLENGSVPVEAMGLIDYWGNLTKARLLLMPPTRHNFVHLNEALRVKRKCE